ncbi:MAG: hypothetical protein M1818_007892 [Claussenomyces sp. TS43310]|nr:MAG: hypothetical protein M1818_007892 [Claussenomyces sp. TS43310]
MATPRLEELPECSAPSPTAAQSQAEKRPDQDLFNPPRCRDVAVELIERLHSPTAANLDPELFLKSCAMDDEAVTGDEVFSPNLRAALHSVVRDDERTELLRRFTANWTDDPRHDDVRQEVMALLDDEIDELGHMTVSTRRMNVLGKSGVVVAARVGRRLLLDSKPRGRGLRITLCKFTSRGNEAEEVVFSVPHDTPFIVLLSILREQTVASDRAIAGFTLRDGPWLTRRETLDELSMSYHKLNDETTHHAMLDRAKMVGDAVYIMHSLDAAFDEQCDLQCDPSEETAEERRARINFWQNAAQDDEGNPFFDDDTYLQRLEMEYDAGR